MTRFGSRHLAATDAQLRLLDLWQTEQGIAMADRYLASQAQKAANGEFAQVYTPDRGGEPPSWVMAKAEYHGLRTASTYWVSRDIMQTIDMSLKDLPREALAPMDLPTKSGFAYFERPLYVQSNRGTTIAVRVIAWFPSHMDIMLGDGKVATVQSMNVTFYSDTRDDNDTDYHDAPNPKMRTAAGRYEMGQPPLVLLSTMSLPWRTVKTELVPGTEVAMVREADGSMHEIDPDDEIAMTKSNLVLEARVGQYGSSRDYNLDEFPVFPVDPDRRLLVEWGEEYATKFLVGLWRFTTQKITRVSNRPYDNPTRKRVERSKHQPEWGDVRVIDLRAYTYPDGTRRPSTEDPEAWTRWTHRWRVSPHWRRQWYPSEQRHKWILIETYIKGPEHLPIVEKDDTRRVVR